MKRFWSVVLPVLICTQVARAETLTVFAAASLKESFQTLSRQFETAHPGVRVVLNFAGSQRLASQIKLGASADVFASAGPEPMKSLSIPEKEWSWFAENRLVIVVPAGKAGLRSLKDLARPMKLVMADKKVPVGTYANAMIDSASKKLGAKWASDVRANVVSYEQDVRSVLTKVELGEADAGIVYASDAVGARGKIATIKIPDAFNPTARYPAVALGNPTPSRLAREFVLSLLDSKSQATLCRFGFESPHRR